MTKFDKTLKKKMKKLRKLVSEKNKAYGDSIGSSKKIFDLYYPNGISPKQYSDVLLVVRILDKLSRIATAKRAFKEDAWQDLAGYALRGTMKDDKNL